MKCLARWLVLSMSVFLAACATASTNEARYAEGLARCRVDGGLRVLRAIPDLQSVLLLGLVRDPSTTRGEFNPKLSPIVFSGGLELWLTQTRLERVYLYIPQPAVSPETPVFGPKYGAPGGVYEVAAAAEEDVRCADPRPRDPSGLIGRLSDGACAEMKYVGPLDLSRYPAVVFSYFDAEVPDEAYQRIVEVLRWRDEDLAQVVTYVYGPGVPPCGHERYLSEVLSR